MRKIEYLDAEVFAGETFTIKLRRGLNDGLNFCLSFSPLSVDTIKYISQKKSICTFVVDFRDEHIFHQDSIKKTFYIVDNIVPDCKCGEIKPVQFFDPECITNLEKIPNEKTKLSILQLKQTADNQINDTFKEMMNNHPEREKIKSEGEKIRQEIINFYTALGYSQVPSHPFLN